MKPRLTKSGAPDRRHLNPGRPASSTPPLAKGAKANSDALLTHPTPQQGEENGSEE